VTLSAVTSSSAATSGSARAGQLSQRRALLEENRLHGRDLDQLAGSAGAAEHVLERDRGLLRPLRFGLGEKAAPGPLREILGEQRLGRMMDVRDGRRSRGMGNSLR